MKLTEEVTILRNQKPRFSGETPHVL